MTPLIDYDFGTYRRGDTVPGFTVKVSSQGSPVNIGTATIRAEFRNKARGLLLSFSVGSGISITDADGGEFQLLDFKAIIPDACYDYDVRMILGGDTYTLVGGKLEIVEPVTELSS